MLLGSASCYKNQTKGPLCSFYLLLAWSLCRSPGKDGKKAASLPDNGQGVQTLTQLFGFKLDVQTDGGGGAENDWYWSN